MMEKALFRKKYLGEVTLKSGEHVKFLFPLTESDVAKYQIEAENIFKRMHKLGAEVKESIELVIEDEVTSSYQVYHGHMASWVVSKDGYVTKTGKNLSHLDLVSTTTSVLLRRFSSSQTAFVVFSSPI